MKTIREDHELPDITWDDVTCNIRCPGGYWDKILRDSEAKGLNVRSSYKAPPTDEEAAMLKNKELCDSFKPIHDMDFIDEKTTTRMKLNYHCNRDQRLQRKNACRTKQSKEFTRKIMKNAFSIGKKNNSTYSDLKIKAMESHSMAWGNVTDIWYAKKEKAKMSDNRSYLKYSVTECMRLFKEDCQGMPKKILLKAGD
ncbi:hypothetical protein M9H77_02980 [Catharanthus roseus]|uniref:Uncharacterized protein n=1 Tax=Catharanthus roseus TaxID=4058 RepID=A0ACC0CA40_CATRO|nr:hypothetical protein M9H77_02980 [Catharanthus roseus]